MCMTTFEKDRYTYRITWSPEDCEYVGLCAEFPSLSWLAESPDTALAGIRKLVSEVVEDMRGNGEEIPESLSCRTYSGKLSVRIPPELHKELSLKAAEEGISLNRLINAKLTISSVP